MKKAKDACSAQAQMRTGLFVAVLALGATAWPSPSYASTVDCLKVFKMAEDFDVPAAKLHDELVSLGARAVANCEAPEDKIQIAKSLMAQPIFSSGGGQPNAARRYMARALLIAAAQETPLFRDDIYDLIYARHALLKPEERENYAGRFAYPVMSALSRLDHPKAIFSFAKSEAEAAMAAFKRKKYDWFHIKKLDALKYLERVREVGDEATKQKAAEIAALLDAAKEPEAYTGAEIAAFLAALVVVAAIAADSPGAQPAQADSYDRCGGWRNSIETAAMMGDADTAAALSLGGCS